MSRRRRSVATWPCSRRTGSCARTHGGAVTQGLIYELPLRYKSGAPSGGEAPDRAGGGGARPRRGVARSDRWHHHDRGGAGAGRPRAAHDRDERLEHRVGARGPAEPPTSSSRGAWRGARRTSSSVPLAEASLAEINLELAILGVDGISAEAGLTTHHEVEAHTNLALIDRARRVVVVTDGSKVGHAAFARICGIERVHELITDASAEAVALAAIAAAGVTVTKV